MKEESNLVAEILTNDINTLVEDLNNVIKAHNVLVEENEQLEDRINKYENPDDLTLFYMWLDEKTKDKIKELEEENKRLKEEYMLLSNASDEYEDKLQERIDKAIEYIENNSLYDEEYDYNYEEEMYLSGIDDEVAKKDLLDLLKGDKE